MAKQGPPKEQPKQKTLKEQKKDIEAKLFGEKNNSKKKELQGMLKKIEFAMKQELDAKKKIEEEKRAAKCVKQLIPVGVDPKTVPCINFLNGTCDRGDGCPFGHITKKEQQQQQTEEPAEKRPKGLCQFLLDAMNSGEYGPTWKCPFPNCTDVHSLVDVTKDIELSLEEYIELQRQSLSDRAGTPVTEETFRMWREKKSKEEALHAKRVAALSVGVKGIDLFKLHPEMFEDDLEQDEGLAEDVDYTTRNYEDSDDDTAVRGEAVASN